MSQATKRRSHDSVVTDRAPSKTRSSGEYLRADDAEGGHDPVFDEDEDAIFATLSADVDATVNRMQQQLADRGENVLSETGEISKVEESPTMPSARFRVDGSMFPDPRTSSIRELLDRPSFERTLLGPDIDDTVESPRIDHDESTDDVGSMAFDDDDQTKIDDAAPNALSGDALGDDESTSPGHSYEIAGREVDYDPSAIDDVVQFHEGPTHLSTHEELDHLPSETEERMHPWFDSGAMSAQRREAVESVGARSDIARENASIAMSTSPVATSASPMATSTTPAAATAAPVRNVRLAGFERLDLVLRLRDLMRKSMETTVEIRVGYLYLAAGGVLLFSITALLAWLIAS